MTVRRIYDRLATEDAYQLGVKVPKVADVVLSRAPIRVACDNAASWFWTSTPRSGSARAAGGNAPRRSKTAAAPTSSDRGRPAPPGNNERTRRD